MGLETDSSEVLNEAIRSTKKFGTVALIADYAAYSNHVLIGAIMEKGIRLVGCGQAPIQGYWNTCLDHISKGEFDPIAILTHRFKLDDIVEVYRRFDTKEDAMMKVFIETKFSNPPMPGTPSLSYINNA